MAKFNYNLLEMDVDKLFEEHKIEDIIEIDKQYDAEIEKKRVELRSMVGDRYKDILAASDAIKTMKTISEMIVSNIDDISIGCQNLIKSTSLQPKSTISVDNSKLEERAVAAQIRLAIVTNEHIWLALDEQDYALAAQFYLFVRHIYVGLFLQKKNIPHKLPIIKRLEDASKSLGERIFKKVQLKLESPELNIEESSSNLIALLLLENYKSTELLSTFIEHRKAALRTVTMESHPSVRVQVSSMLKCLINTVHLLHSCFLSKDESGKSLIERNLQMIVDASPPTLTKIDLPTSPLFSYIPDIVKQFRPKLNTNFESLSDNDTKCVDEWLKITAEIIGNGLNKSLNLVTTIKGLHIIREDAYKIELPLNWEKTCSHLRFPKDFNIWQYYFQELLTNRAKVLITNKISSIIEDICSDISKNLVDLDQLQKAERNLQSMTWNEEQNDVSRLVDDHLGLSMKTKGFSPVIVELCSKFDEKYLRLLEDASCYFYGKEFSSSEVQYQLSLTMEKHTDRLLLEKHLQNECGSHTEKLIKFLKDVIKEESVDLVTRALMCARFCHALTLLCPNFRKCCSFNNDNTEWDKICLAFSSCSLSFWNVWVDDCMNRLSKNCTELLSDVNIKKTLKLLMRWDVIEIQEQTEEKIFKSQIRIPSHTSLALQELLVNLTDFLNSILPHTLPKQIHSEFIARATKIILERYSILSEMNLNQTQALQFLFDVKFLTTFCVARENAVLITKSQEICDRLRSKIDPFDLDVFYSHLQGNVKKYVIQSQTILGCLLPSSGQLASLGVPDKNKELKSDPSILALSTPSSTTWFQLLPVTVPVQKMIVSSSVKDSKDAKVSSQKQVKSTVKKPTETTMVKSGAAALFGGLTTDWFS